MAEQVEASPELVGRLARAGIAAAEPGAGGAGVVVTTAGAAKAWPPESLAAAVVVQVGDGALPRGAAAFLILPHTAEGDALARAVHGALEVARLRREVSSLRRSGQEAMERQVDLLRVGIALSGERNLEALLTLILSTARDLARADAGSLYLVDERGGERVLRFVLAQNDSVTPSFAASSLPVDATSFAGFVALSGEPLAVNDARSLPVGTPYRFNPAFDEATGYFTRAILTTPMITRAGEVIGVLQLINHRRPGSGRITSAEGADALVGPFGAEQVVLIRALAAQAAVAIENGSLIRDVERLFEGFVRASVRAIEQRDPATSGHSQRVAQYTVALARALEHAQPSPYRGLRFSRDELTQLRYAGLLHDFGKVGVREAVLTKGKKLYPERLSLVRERFRHALRARETAILRGLLAELVASRRTAREDDLDAARTARHRIAAELDAALMTVLAANEPLVLDGAADVRLQDVARESFPGIDEEQVPLLLPEEIRALSVQRGSLDEEERREVESHVVHTYQFLLTIPWPRRFLRVPEIAYAHHETLDGRGYPRRLAAAGIPLEARMMTVCDIFDALHAGDRPYKRAVPVERALDILADEARTGALEPLLVEVFADARVWSHASPGAAEPL